MKDEEKEEVDLLTEAVEDWTHLCHATAIVGDLARARAAVIGLLQKKE
jgi:hypothetical protein